MATEAQKRYKREWVAKNLEHVRKYAAEYRDENREYRRKQQRERSKRKEVQERNLRNTKASKERFPGKEDARAKLRYEVRVGRIKRQPCEVCGKENGQGHHNDYSKPLEVVWLCPVHHKQLHMR